MGLILTGRTRPEEMECVFATLLFAQKIMSLTLSMHHMAASPRGRSRCGQTFYFYLRQHYETH